MKKHLFRAIVASVGLSVGVGAASSAASSHLSESYTYNSTTNTLEVSPNGRGASYNALMKKVESSLGTLVEGMDKITRKSNIQTGINVAHGILTFTTSILQMTGVIPNPQMMLLKSIFQTVMEINLKIDSLNDTVNEMYARIEKEFAEMKYLFDVQTVTANLQTLTMFSQLSLDPYLTQLKTLMNSSYNDFVDYERYPYKESYSFDESVAIGVGEETGNKIAIDGADIKKYAENAPAFSIDDPEAWFKDVFGKIFDEYFTESHPDVLHALKLRRAYGFNDDSFKDAFSSACFKYFTFTFFKEIASQIDKSTGTSYSGTILSAYNAYVNAFVSPMQKSPLTCEYENIERSFNFQGDTNYIDSNGNERSLILDIGNIFIYNVYRFAMYAYITCTLSGLVSESDIEAIITSCNAVTNKIYTQMVAEYKVNKETGEPYDNYCYHTKCPVEVDVNTISLNSKSTIKMQYSSNYSSYHLEDYNIGKLVCSNRGYKMLSGEDLTYLRIVALENYKRNDFQKYLSERLGTEVKSQVVTSIEEQSLWFPDDYRLMVCYQFGNHHGDEYGHNPGAAKGEMDPQQIIVNDQQKYEYEGEGKHKLQNGEFEQGQFKQINGSVFTLDTGDINEEQSLYSIAFYDDKHSTHSETTIFSQCGTPGTPYVVGETIQTFYDGNNKGGNNEGDVAFDDGNMQVIFEKEEKVPGEKSHYVTHEIVVNSTTQSLVCIPVAEYGEWNPTSSPDSPYFNKSQTAKINQTIDAINLNLNDSEKVHKMEDVSNDAKYIIEYDIDKEDRSSRNQFFNYASTEANLLNISSIYDDYKSRIDGYYKTYPDEQYKEIPYDSTDKGDAINLIIDKIKELKENGFDTKGVELPGPSATNISVYATTDVQVQQELSMVNGSVSSRVVPTFIVKAVLGYTEDAEQKYYVLPSEVSEMLSIPFGGDDNLFSINIPSPQKYASFNGAVFKYDDSIVDHYDTDYQLLNKFETSASQTYVPTNVPGFSAYSYLEATNVTYPEYELVEGDEPTCATSGYKPCYKYNGLYYVTPGTLIGTGSLADYNIWKSSGGDGYLPRLSTHKYVYDIDDPSSHVFNPTNETFTFTIKCIDCGTTYTSQPIKANFRQTVPATCSTNARGIYWTITTLEGVKCAARTDEVEKPNSTTAHTPVYHEARPASCTLPGNEKYYKCEHCDKYFRDEECKHEITDPAELIIPKTNHKNAVHHEFKDSDFEHTGNIEYWECPDCNCFFEDAFFEHRIQEIDTIIPIKGCTYEKHECTLPTHYTSGCDEYYYSPEKKKYYLDDKGIEEIEDFEAWKSKGGDGYIEKEPCEFGGPVQYIIANGKCTASHACQYPGCKEIEQETVDAEFIVDTPATCTEDAKGHYAASFSNPAFGAYVTPANSDVKPGTAIGHLISHSDPKWDGKLCTITGTCDHCQKSLTLTKEGVLVIDSPATCLNNAFGHYEVSFDNLGVGKLCSVPFEIENSALGHLFDGGECIRCHAKDPNVGMPTGGIIALTVGCSVGSVILFAFMQYLMNLNKLGKKKKTSKK